LPLSCDLRHLGHITLGRFILLKFCSWTLSSYILKIDEKKHAKTSFMIIPTRHCMHTAQFHIYVLFFSSLVSLPEIFRYHYVTKALLRPTDILHVSSLYNPPCSHWRQQYWQASSKAAPLYSNTTKQKPQQKMEDHGHGQVVHLSLLKVQEKTTLFFFSIKISVPDPDPPEPHVLSGSINQRYCAAHVCTLFSSTANVRESYGSQVYQGMQSSREETWVGPSVTAL
jgi:hypothetical protein